MAFFHERFLFMIRQETGAPFGSALSWLGWDVAVNTTVLTATAPDFQEAFSCGRESSPSDEHLAPH